VDLLDELIDVDDDAAIAAIKVAAQPGPGVEAGQDVEVATEFIGPLRYHRDRRGVRACPPPAQPELGRDRDRPRTPTERADLRHGAGVPGWEESAWASTGSRVRRGSLVHEAFEFSDRESDTTTDSHRSEFAIPDQVIDGGPPDRK
jgi:hypothetical protein